jgi:hypothetical protein
MLCQTEECVLTELTERKGKDRIKLAYATLPVLLILYYYYSRNNLVLGNVYFCI